MPTRVCPVGTEICQTKRELVRWLFCLLRAHAQILNSLVHPCALFCLLLRAARTPLIFALCKNATAGSTQECCACRFLLTTCALLTTQLPEKRIAAKIRHTHFSEFLTSLTLLTPTNSSCSCTPAQDGWKIIQIQPTPFESNSNSNSKVIYFIKCGIYTFLHF
jgi:hypothetical protein